MSLKSLLSTIERRFSTDSYYDYIHNYMSVSEKKYETELNVKSVFKTTYKEISIDYYDFGVSVIESENYTGDGDKYTTQKVRIKVSDTLMSKFDKHYPEALI